MLEGLEISEILKSQLENEFTLGSEYYSSEFLYPFTTLVNSNSTLEKLSECCSLITDGDHGSAEYVDDGITFILSEAVKNGWVDSGACRQISTSHAAKLNRSKLRKNDVLITKTGIYFGRSAVVTDEFVGANTIAHVGLLRLKNKINPFYVSTFFNSIYGYSQLRRRGLKATRPEIKLIEFQDILISLPSNYFQCEIEEIIKTSGLIFLAANQAYKDAEQQLMGVLNFKLSAKSSDKVSIKSFKSSFATTARLDAEYYQLKYQDYFNLIAGYKNGYDKLSSVCGLGDDGFNPEDNTEYKYIELSNIDKVGVITGFTQAIGSELPSRARRRVNEGDVLISSIEGSLSSCAIVTAELDGALCSTGFYVIRSPKVNSETLLVLFKSQLMQELLRQGCSGTILTAINKYEFLNLPIPIIEDDIQLKIACSLKESFKLKAESERLLDVAKCAVEIAIEQDEAAALSYINAEVQQNEESFSFDIDTQKIQDILDQSTV
ncbi:hypothetical protein LBMAG43_11590 [Methylococcaceae bacterium]|nr:hypothetical protein LBMAG43_11590 [Methylococcaceae bacterium]